MNKHVNIFKTKFENMLQAFSEIEVFVKVTFGIIHFFSEF